MLCALGRSFAVRPLIAVHTCPTSIVARTSPLSSSSDARLDAAAIMKKNQDDVANKIREQVHPTIKGRRRFYKEVSVRPVAAAPSSAAAAAAAVPDQPLFEVALDGRALRSPGRRLMHLRSEGLAWAIAAEWDAQGGPRGINPSTMPLMSLTATWLDQTAEARGAVVTNVAKYLHTDTICFYAAPELRGLRKRQEKAFKGVHGWMAEDWGVDLATTDSVFKVKHPPATVGRVLAMVQALDDAALTALQCATMETKSLVLALALVLRKVSRAAASGGRAPFFQTEQ